MGPKVLENWYGKSGLKHLIGIIIAHWAGTQWCGETAGVTDEVRELRIYGQAAIH